LIVFITDGFCVAETTNLRVFREIFVQVYAPYAMKRREQTSLRVAVFNYGDEATDVCGLWNMIFYT